MAATDGRNPGLFHQSCFYIVKSDELGDDEADNLVNTIKLHGGEVVAQSSADSILLGDLTHIISTTIDFRDYVFACDRFIPVVKPSWVEQSLLKMKLAQPRQFNPDPRLFLSNVVLMCAPELPEGDKDAIIGGVLAMGGSYSSKLSMLTTHMVALTADSDKAQMIIRKGLKTKIVLPHWFDDCLKLGKRIDERPYILPDPQILQANISKPIPSSANKSVVGASTPEPSVLPSPAISPSGQRRTANVLQGKTVMLCKDLKIGKRLLNSHEELITRCGGAITERIADCDMFICRYREGEAFRLASKAGKDVGNLSWLYYLITYNTWTSPLKRLLHFPVAREGIPGFKDLKISLSNYSGEARVYLENLIIAAGAEPTKTLKSENTHLITAHGSSEKCDAAREWNIAIVNHLWLEESYAKWQLQTVSKPTYTHFPARTNLTEVVGQVPIDRKVLEEKFFRAARDDDREMPDNTPPLPKPRTTNPVPQSSAILSPKRDTTSNRPTPKTTSRTTNKDTSLAPLKTPAAQRFSSSENLSGKENDTPTSTSSRRSKTVAASRIHDFADDIALYEKEKKRVGGVIHGGRRRKEDEVQPVTASTKRSAEPEDESESSADEMDVDSEEDRRTMGKKGAKRVKSGVAMHLLLTGYTAWQGNLKKEDADRRKLRDLGIIVVTDASKCTHLAAASILRTTKFIVALASAPTILNTDFVDACLKAKKLLSPEDYPLLDPKGEARYGIKLEQALINAKANKNHLLADESIYCVESIYGGFDVFRQIVAANGGTCTMYRGRSGPSSISLIPSKRTDDSQASASAEEDKAVYLISATKPDQVRLWGKFKDMAIKARRVPRIVKSDWLLESAMGQAIRGWEEYELTEEDVEGDE